ncbi:MAG: alpha/beta hydrolase, partial [Actinomycetota bacterium]|nr:alpha/beta hydrolase [Actinomycetota bacterium]
MERVSFEARGDGGNALRGDLAGEGPTIVEAHGLTAVRSYVTHGSTVLERGGFKIARYDARGHGESDPAPHDAGYTYAELAQDMGAIVDHFSPDESVILAGHSMGAHTAVAFTLERPERVAALILIGPVARGEPTPAEVKQYWERLSRGLEEDGVEGFLRAYDDGSLNPEWREVIVRFTRRRLALHRDMLAVARALREVPESLPFVGLSALASIQAPALVVASHDNADPGHPYAVAEAWAERLSEARLVSEEEGESPLAWQGGKLSKEIASFCAEPAVQVRL